MKQVTAIRSSWCWSLLSLSMVVAFLSTASAQDLKYKPYAPGVLKSIPSALDVRDSFSLPMPMPGVKLNQYSPGEVSVDQTLYGHARRVMFFRDVWQYDFAFTGLRQVSLSTLGNKGQEDRNVWYMIYRVRDIGETMTYDEVKKDPAFDQIHHELKRGEDVADRHFLPRFSLEGWVTDPKTKAYKKVVYRNVVAPRLARQIRKREDPSVALYDSVEMSKLEIPKVDPDSEAGVWGVAIWEDVDPNIDYVSVYGSGLTNAYRIIQKDGEISFKKKTLQLNFWRPGDRIDESKDNVRFGIPLVDDPREQVLIARRYDLPGPVLRSYIFSKDADSEVLIAETDAMVNLKDFKSAITPVLNKGNLPASVAEAITKVGYDIDPDVGVDAVIQGEKWIFSQGGERFVLKLEPLFWEPSFEGIRFIKRLDSMWIYR